MIEALLVTGSILFAAIASCVVVFTWLAYALGKNWPMWVGMLPPMLMLWAFLAASYYIKGGM